MINIMFCGNSKIFDGMIIALLSIIKYNKMPLNVYILTMDLHELNDNYLPINDEQVNVLNKILKDVNSNSNAMLIDITDMFHKQMLNSANIATNYTPYILVRLFSDEIKELPDKILYLDTDVVCYGNIEELYNKDIENYDFAAVVDYIGKFFINPRYINSGMLLMNLKKMRNEHLLKKCRDMVIEKKMLLPDQTALNKICKDKLYLPRKYNEQRKRKKDTVIRHYSMQLRFIPYFRFVNIKPWNIKDMHDIYNVHDYDDVYDKFLEIKKKFEEK